MLGGLTLIKAALHRVIGDTEWHPMDVDGQDILVRDSCGYVDAVLVEGQRIYLVSLAMDQRARSGPLTIWRQFLASIVTRPKDPILRSTS